MILVDLFDLAIDEFRRQVSNGVRRGLAITLAAKKFQIEVTILRKEMSRRSASKRSRLSKQKKIDREKLALSKTNKVKKVPVVSQLEFQL